jgi:hypothetical protein
MNKFRTAAVALVLVMAFCLPAMAAELRLPRWLSLSSLDPHKVSDIYSANVIRQIYSNLVQVNENMEIVPDLAEKWENPMTSLDLPSPEGREIPQRRAFHRRRREIFHRADQGSQTASPAPPSEGSGLRGSGGRLHGEDRHEAPFAPMS